MFDASFTEGLESLGNLLDVVKSAVAKAERISDADALQVRDKIAGSIPAELRHLYPEDDTLAALAFAEVYYTLQMEEEE